MVKKNINIIIASGILIIISCILWAYISTNNFNPSVFYGFYYIQRERLTKRIDKYLYDVPVPVRTVQQDILNNKITNPEPWVLKQINKDFSNFTNGSSDTVINTFNMFPENQWVVMFTIKQGKLSVEKKLNYMNGAAERGLYIYSNVFRYLAKYNYITNLSFLVRFSDFFNEIPNISPLDIAPILTTSKDLNKELDKDLILIPDYMSLEDIPKFMPRIRAANKFFPWSNKENKIYWRGGYADVSGLRKIIVDYSSSHPDSMIDAKFVVKSSDFIPPEFQLKFKFLLNIDGHTAAWTRPIWQLQSNSVMLKQNSNLVQWYYDAIQPDMHFIAVDSDPVAIIEKINQYTNGKLHKIATAGSNFAENNLTINDMVAYIALVLQRYEQLQNIKK